MDLFEEPNDNAHEFSVSEISGAVKKAIEGEFGHVRVRGEVGRVVLARTGHLYFDLKDDRNVLASVSWKGQVARLAHRPEEGMEVIATGRLTTFGPQSKYQLNVEDVRPAGAGALMAMLEKRKAALAAEGLFAAERKQQIPYLPEIIGVVTSPTGAVIRDILHRLRDRFPRKVLVWPVAVQGQGCAQQVANAIEGFNNLTPGGALPRPDLIIVARGGGSIEDLWGFNEEIVVRAAAASQIPLISAVGHETDTTLIDFASDIRAPTPTAAAELAVPVRLELLNWLDNQNARLSRSLVQTIDLRRQRLRDMARALPQKDHLLDGPRQRLDVLSDKLEAGLKNAAARKRLALTEASGHLRPSVLKRLMTDSQRSLNAWDVRLAPALGRVAERRREALDARVARLRPQALAQQLARTEEKYDGLTVRLSDVATRAQQARMDRLQSLDRLRETLSYRATLERGYAVVRSDGDVITTAKEAGKAGALEIEFADGCFEVGQAASKPAPKKKDTPPTQGSLF
ncbi:exodeoxyribonuclease VII large subunit [Marivivens donghaensis]|uniref:Exodeoxyribonuclease 7 large subunit n=1 Tax=Marivivens donghaensis TaxID=1699413 RepID=A0ABX0VUA6_9RHOB|nr:exodeoxyribonuclease VII large subunit [Marivivens donghaensis]NIY71148.1 exodeoxyribonuclease VII large subunit [Marivivens donghaensis]